ncbi:MAG TPA: hypothetical protein VFW16_05695, partial [Streptosporangiaceae bacterium]|nr:hypothetical protein [Streptosporangiaceae bacterium]
DAGRLRPRAALGCLVDLGRRERWPGGRSAKGEEERVVELFATTTTLRGARAREEQAEGLPGTP